MQNFRSEKRVRNLNLIAAMRNSRCKRFSESSHPLISYFDDEKKHKSKIEEKRLRELNRDRRRIGDDLDPEEEEEIMLENFANDIRERRNIDEFEDHLAMMRHGLEQGGEFEHNFPEHVDDNEDDIDAGVQEILDKKRKYEADPNYDWENDSLFQKYRPSSDHHKQIATGEPRQATGFYRFLAKKLLNGIVKTIGGRANAVTSDDIDEEISEKALREPVSLPRKIKQKPKSIFNKENTKRSFKNPSAREDRWIANERVKDKTKNNIQDLSKRTKPVVDESLKHAIVDRSRYKIRLPGGYGPLKDNFQKTAHKDYLAGDFSKSETPPPVPQKIPKRYEKYHNKDSVSDSIFDLPSWKNKGQKFSEKNSTGFVKRFSRIK